MVFDPELGALLDRGEVDLLRRRLDAGLDPNDLHAGYPWMLHRAAWGSAAACALLLERGARVDAVDQWGRTPLFDAKHGEVARVLLAGGADPSAVCTQPKGVTPLMSAADQGRLEVCRVLLAAGATIDARTPSGGTALAFACDQGHADIVLLLLDHGAAVARGGRLAPLARAKAHPVLRENTALLARLASPGKKPAPAAAKRPAARAAAADKAPPPELEASFRARGAKPIDLVRLARRLEADGGVPDPDLGPYVPSAELARRYGFALPPPVRQLLDLADLLMIEDARTRSFRYARIAPGGWDLPPPQAGSSQAQAVCQRFAWNTFSNLQLWEHFAGCLTIGSDRGDNRLVAATVDDAAPVFWLDHETAELHGAIAPGLEPFLRVQLGQARAASAHHRALIIAPDTDARAEDGRAYLPRTGPLRAWPPFLSARADWMVAALAFGRLERLHQRPEATAFDLERERSWLSRSEPIALAWLTRAFLLGLRDVFEEVVGAAAAASPLAASFAALYDERWSDPASDAPLARARAATRTERAALTAPWPSGLPSGELV